jgi:hypothetical protein
MKLIYIYPVQHRSYIYNTLSYADDAESLAESKDGPQRFLHQFNLTAKEFSMKTSTRKATSIVISKEPIRCTLVVQGNTTE